MFSWPRFRPRALAWPDKLSVVLAVIHLVLWDLRAATSAPVTATSFPVQTFLPLSFVPIGLGQGDLDGDGKPEIIAFDEGMGVVIYRNVATPGLLTTNSFVPALQLKSALAATQATVADLDGDGKTDLIITVGGGVSIFRNTGTKPGEISFANRVDWVFGQASLPNEVALGDVDGDGKIDLAFLNHDGLEVRVMRNLATPGNLKLNSLAQVFRLTYARPNNVLFSDVNQDGKPDLVFRNYQKLVVCLNRLPASGAWFEPGVEFLLNNTSPNQVGTGLIAADMNRDGQDEFLTYNSTVEPLALSRFFQTGPGPWQSNTVFTPLGRYTEAPYARVADLDGDGLPEVLANKWLSQTLGFYKNQPQAPPGGAVTLDQWRSFEPRLACSRFVVADFDGDGRPDIAGTVFNQKQLILARQAGDAPSRVIKGLEDLRVSQSGVARFSVEVRPDSPATFQWFFGQKAIPGATNAFLVITNTSYARAGVYGVDITGADGSWGAREQATLAYFDSPLEPKIYNLLESTNVAPGSAFSTYISTSGGLPLFYQWYFDGRAWPGATNSTLDFPYFSSDYQGVWQVLVSNAWGVSRSDAITLTAKRKSGASLPPWISPMADEILLEDTPARPIHFMLLDDDTPLDQIQLSASFRIGGMILPDGVTFGGEGTNRTITLTPLPNQFGKTEVRITAKDEAGNTRSNALRVEVKPVNDPPVISLLPDVSTRPDLPAKIVRFRINDEETTASELRLHIESSNPALIPGANIVPGGQGVDRTLAITPLPGQSGDSLITVTVLDPEGAQASATFRFTVSNDPVPAISLIPDQISPDGSPVTISFALGENESAAAAIQLAAFSTVTSVVANRDLVFGGAGTQRTLTLTPMPYQSGATIIVITARNASGVSASANFWFHVTATNHPPEITPIADQELPANDTGRAITFHAADEETPFAILRFRATSSNPGLIDARNILLAGEGFERTVTLLPERYAHGQATITITVEDAGLASGSASFQVLVRPPPDWPPRLTVSQTAKDTWLSWSREFADAILESSSSLAPEDWQRLPGQPLLRENRMLFELAFDAGARYFRLRLP